MNKYSLNLKDIYIVFSSAICFKGIWSWIDAYLMEAPVSIGVQHCGGTYRPDLIQIGMIYTMESTRIRAHDCLGHHPCSSRIFQTPAAPLYLSS